MSLINEALKKAQRTRTGDLSDALPPMPGGGRVAKRSQPRTSQQLILIAAGAIVLVVLSVVATVYLVNRPAAPKPVAPPQKTVEAPPAPAIKVPPVVAPALNPPVLTTRPATELPPAVTQTPASENPPAATAPAIPEPKPIPSAPIAVAPPPAAAAPSTSAITSPPPPPVESPAPVLTTPTPAPSLTPAIAPAAPPAAVVAAPKHDERVNQFVDAIRVAGIRPSGTESRVLMNDRVFRVNEIVERNFGLRLTKVEANALTFTDANGAIYVKNF